MEYLLITADGEPNIGILRYNGKTKYFEKESLIKALEAHFDSDVSIKNSHIISEFPLTYIVVAERYEDGEESPFPFTVTLEKTWLY